MSIGDISLDTSAMEAYGRYLQQAPKIAREEMSLLVEQALFLLEREVKEFTPVGATALLRSSIAHELTGTALEDGLGVSGKVFSPMAHAVPVELGTKPHWVGPEGFLALRDWVSHKLDVPDDDLDNVTMAIAFKIAKHGTKGAHMFERAFDKNVDQVSSILNQAPMRISTRLIEMR